MELDAGALQTLQTWFSPSLPTGAFAHSHGLEAAIDAGDVTDAPSARDWVRRAVRSGGLGNDAILAAEAWKIRRGDASGASGARDGPVAPDALDALDDLARALVAGRERLIESLDQGAAFAAATNLPGPRRALPVAIGAAAARAALPLEATLVAMLHAAASNLVWIGARLVPYGQGQALDAVEELRPAVRASAARAAACGLDGLGSDALGADLASLAHESQRSRVCRT